MNWNDLFEICQAGGAMPAVAPVNAADLRRYWDFMRRIQTPPTGEGAVGIGHRIIEDELAGADAVAVWLRAALLGLLQTRGALKEWEHGTDLDDAVFQAAAVFPFGGNKVDVESFRERLRSGGAAE